MARLTAGNICEVCCGEGNYPIINRYGRTLYYITCPDCLGDGKCSKHQWEEARAAALAEEE